MDAPTLILVPPTPLRFDTPSAAPSSSSSSPSSSAHRPTSVHQHRLSRQSQPTRDSSDAIYSIYSMYGDDTNARASVSWTNPPHNHDRTRSRDTISPPTVKIELPRDRPISAVTTRSNDHSDLAYYSPEQDEHVPPAALEKLDSQRGMVGMGDSPRGSLATTSSARPPSSYATPSSLRAQSDLFEDPGLAGSSNLRKSDLSASSYTSGPSQSKEYRRSVSVHSKRSSRGSPSPHQHSSLRDLPPLPPSVRNTPSPTPSRQPSPSPAHPHITPKTSMNLNGKIPSPFNSPSSKVSLVPSEGEDLDGFHVRNTYAQLEASGVRGDGYEEGVERTRARIGTSRTSQLQAEAALADGDEKKRPLDDKEIQLLRSVDRYGFFSVTSHDRLILLNATPLLKKLTHTPAGPPTASANATTVNALPPVTIPPKEPSRIAKWTRMLVPQKRQHGGNVETWTIRPSKEAKFRERLYKGIPDRWRRAAWDLLMCRYSGLPPRTFEILALEYREGLERPSPYDIQIDLDVPRTISGHIMFRTRYGAGQRSLFHVLHSFSLRCSSCGYVQGMGPIAATLLCYFEPERVYSSLVILHDSYKLHDVFNAGFPGMLEAIYVQERIMALTMPAVYEAFRKNMISTTSYATKWYITLFANSVPFQTQLRLWDVFLLEGYDVFVAMAVAIVWVYRDHITSSSANFETILSLLSSFFVPEDEDALMSWIGTTLGDKKFRGNMTNWRQAWKKLVAEGKEGSALL
ncbi:TBC domain-containing protein [Psilocybe cubensis]|uniref:TBC domain-containing protein n=2 Tax=Psilocybe cubensis TaxID=181762 RepID=A0ACB8HFG4_PSICU|nr:TBC domain-containing protein [Psilocybe cubensis]KAH9486452.1 TBC domain-containing protein [Psilocybe cubensis]